MEDKLKDAVKKRDKYKVQFAERVVFMDKKCTSGAATKLSRKNFGRNCCCRQGQKGLLFRFWSADLFLQWYSETVFNTCNSLRNWYFLPFFTLTQRFVLQKLFVKLKVNSSLVLDQYIQQLNAAIGHNRQILERSIKGDQIAHESVCFFLLLRTTLKTARDPSEALKRFFQNYNLTSSLCCRPPWGVHTPVTSSYSIQGLVCSTSRSQSSQSADVQMFSFGNTWVRG